MIRIATLIAITFLAGCVRSPQLPVIPDQTPYEQVRERMIQAGFSPQRVDHRSYSVDEPPRPAAQWCPADSDEPICARYSELMYCTLGMHERCGWLYRAERGGRYAVVTTRCETFEAKYCFEDVRWEDNEDELREYLIAPFGKPASRRR